MHPVPGKRTSDSSDSPFRLIFSQAWGRLTKSPAFVRWEVFIWSVIAARAGFEIFGFYSAEADRAFAAWCIGLAAVLTPFFIGPWVYRTHVSVGLADDALRTVPVRPVVIVGARAAAVALRWLRTLGVPALFGIHLYNLGSPILNPVQRWYEFFGSMFGDHSEPLKLLLIGFGIFALTLWVALPMTWALMWGSRMIRSGGAFFFAYFSYLAVLSGLAFVAMGIHFLPHQLTQPGLARPPLERILDWLDMTGPTVAVILATLITLFLFWRACFDWGRRLR